MKKANNNKVFMVLIIFLACISFLGCERKIANGVKKELYLNGRLKKITTYKNYKKDGPCKTFYKNGKVRMEFEFVKDKPHGPVIFYKENGYMEKVVEYNNGKYVGVIAMTAQEWEHAKEARVPGENR